MQSSPPQQHPVSFESQASPETLLRKLDQVLSQKRSAIEELPANLDLRGSVDGNKVTIHRNTMQWIPRAEFRGIAIPHEGGSSLAGAYYDPRAHIRLFKFAAPVAFTAASAYGLGESWDLQGLLTILGIACIASVFVYVSDRFHLANRNAERDLLRKDIEVVVSQVKMKSKSRS